MNLPLCWQLLAHLANGRCVHVQRLVEQFKGNPKCLADAFQRLPAHLRDLLVMKGQLWCLSHKVALIAPQELENIARETGYSAIWQQECTSTNDVLLQQAKAGNAVHKQLCLSVKQTAGRGRQGKVWESDEATCLTFSTAWTFDKVQAALSALPLVVALAAAETLKALGENCRIKWPNDLMLNDKKLGGILVESVCVKQKTTVIIGLGINFLPPSNASLQATYTQKASAAELLHGFLQRLNALMLTFEEQDFAALQVAYEALQWENGQRVALSQDGEVIAQGDVAGVSAEGALLLNIDGVRTKFVAGEVSLRPVVREKVQVAHCLLLDGGNSKLKWAWVEHGQIVLTGKAPYFHLDELAQQWEAMSKPDTRVAGVAVCSKFKQGNITRLLPVNIEWLSSMSEAFGICNHYQNHREHGADRWFNILGSRRFSDKACVIVSCGTAVTIDALTHDNHYLGGSILPGYHLMQESLYRRTANLNILIGKPHPFATNTANALASGLSDAVCGALLLMHQRLSQHTKQPCDVIITGGGALKTYHGLPAAFHLDNRVEIVDNLVIHGLLHWVQQS